MKRISIVVLILCASFVSVAWGQQPGCEFSPFWAEFHKENMERWNRCEKVLGVNNVGSLSLKWRLILGNASSPAVANGVVYFSSGGSVHAREASTGAKLWTYGGRQASSPAVANGMVYVGSIRNQVNALNASTGALLWS
jgi:glucose dehydrogenase